MTAFLDTLRAAPPVPLLAGVALLLLGWLLYRLVLTASGGILGAAIGLGLALFASELFRLEGTPALATQALGALAGLLAGVVLFHWMHHAAFFLTGAVLGAWGFAETFTRLQANGMAIAETTLVAGTAAAGLVAGLIMLAAQRHVIAIVSAAAGTMLIMGALGWPGGAIGTGVLFVLGLALQLRLTRRRRDEEENEDTD